MDKKSSTAFRLFLKVLVLVLRLLVSAITESSSDARRFIQKHIVKKRGCCRELLASKEVADCAPSLSVLVYHRGNRRDCLGEDLPHKARVFPGLFKGLGVYSWIVSGIPATRYRERVTGESHEATEAGDSKDPLHLLPSVHVAEERVLSSPVPRPQPMFDASRLWSYGGRPSGIPSFLGLDNPVTGCQLGSILEASPS